MTNLIKLQHQFYKSLEGFNSRFISEDVKTGLGFTMDAEIIVDSFAKPLQVSRN